MAAVMQMFPAQIESIGSGFGFCLSVASDNKTCNHQVSMVMKFFEQKLIYIYMCFLFPIEGGASIVLQ